MLNGCWENSKKTLGGNFFAVLCSEKTFTAQSLWHHNCSQSAPIKIFLENQSIILKDMDKSEVARFYWPTVYTEWSDKNGIKFMSP